MNLLIPPPRMAILLFYLCLIPGYGVSTNYTAVGLPTNLSFDYGVLDDLVQKLKDESNSTNPCLTPTPNGEFTLTYECCKIATKGYWKQYPAKDIWERLVCIQSSVKMGLRFTKFRLPGSFRIYRCFLWSSAQLWDGTLTSLSSPTFSRIR
jgi:hypothetical protein